MVEKAKAVLADGASAVKKQGAIARNNMDKVGFAFKEKMGEVEQWKDEGVAKAQSVAQDAVTNAKKAVRDVEKGARSGLSEVGKVKDKMVDQIEAQGEKAQTKLAEAAANVGMAV